MWGARIGLAELGRTCALAGVLFLAYYAHRLLPAPLTRQAGWGSVAGRVRDADGATLDGSAPM